MPKPPAASTPAGILRLIAEGTAAATGDEFFRSLARSAAVALGARYAFVAETLSELESHSLAFWDGDDFGKSFRYKFPGTPCQRVAAGHVCVTNTGLIGKYPDDVWLQQIGADSYVGVPMRNAQGRTLGHLAVLHTEPMSPSDADVDALQIFAARGCAELERKHTEERLRKAHAELRRVNREAQALLKITRAIGHHLQRHVLFGALSDCLHSVVPADGFAIALPHGPDHLEVFVLTSRNRRGEDLRPELHQRTGSAAGWVIEQREPHLAAAREEVRASFPETWRTLEQEQLESLCVLPLIAGERVRGALLLMAAAKGAYSEEQFAFYQQIAGAIAVALDDCLAQEEMRRLADELSAQQIAKLENEKVQVERERKQLQAHNVYLQEEIRSQHNFVEIVGNSPALLAALRRADQVAPTESTVLILGETGTGKELIARAIHDRSARCERPLVKVNCGAISAGLVESELFGHVKGAFTGALANREGRFALADGGTIFLDEIGELPLETQVKLLRVLQEQEFEPIGSSKTVKVNVRVIAATHRDLPAMLREGKFRADLYYRVNVFPLTMPALRDRREDVPLLTKFFVEKFSARLGRRIAEISEETMARLCAYSWPGNVRELQNVIERAAVLAAGPVLHIDEGSLEISRTAALGDLAALAPPTPAKPADPSLEEVERQHILSILAQTNWRIEGNAGAARLLNLQPSTLRSRMQRLGIARQR